MGRVDFAVTWGSSLVFKESCILIIRDSLASLYFIERKAESPDINLFKGSFPVGTSGKEPTCQCRRLKRCEFNPWVGKILGRRAWQPTPVFLPGESHGLYSRSYTFGYFKHSSNKHIFSYLEPTYSTRPVKLHPMEPSSNHR